MVAHFNPHHPGWQHFWIRSCPMERTFTRQFREHPKGNPTSTNSIASIFTWTRDLARRENLDETLEALAFTESLENACVDTVSVDGIMTKNLAISCGKIGKIGKEDYVNTTEFMLEKRVKIKLKERLWDVVSGTWHRGDMLFLELGNVLGRQGMKIIRWRASCSRCERIQQLRSHHLAMYKYYLWQEMENSIYFGLHMYMYIHMRLTG